MLTQTDDVEFDPAAAHPEAGRLRAALWRRDWTACRAVLDPRTPGERSALLRFVCDQRDIDDFLRFVLRQDPYDGAAAALLGLNLIDMAWEIRGRAPSVYVSARQFAGFRDMLCRAEAVLIDAAARHPGEPAVWVGRLMTARGLELGLPETRRRYDRLVAAEPHHLPGQTQFLQSLCPKWGGSWPELHSWAWTAAMSAPPGAVQGALVAEAAVEQIFAQDGEPDRAAVYRAAQHTVWHPEFRRVPGWVQAAGSFALLFGLFGDRPAARSMFALLGPFAARRPWDYLPGDPADVIREHRRLAA